MSLYPDAEHRLIPPGSNDPRIRPIGIIYHVDAGNARSLYDYFNGRSGGIESHLHVPKSDPVEQYRDTRYEADANYRGNSFWLDGERVGFISVETQGYEFGEWNSKQLRDMRDIAEWGHEEHGIPLRQCRAWNDPGLGYHVMFGAPGPWTPNAKTCPGPDRVKQWPNFLASIGGKSMSWNESLEATETAQSRFPENYSNRAEHVLMHILGLAYNINWGGIRFNQWMRERWGDITLSPRVLIRSGYGHAREGKERIRDSVEPQLKAVRDELVAQRELIAQFIAAQPNNPLTEAQIHRAVTEAIQNNVVNVEVSVNPVDEDEE